MATKIELIYNPYTVDTKFKVNGAEGIDEAILNLTRGQRLQIWIDKIFEELFKNYNTQDIDFEFTGTALDAEDVRDAVYLFNKKAVKEQITLTCNESTKSIDDKTQRLKELYAEAQKGPFKEFQSDIMKFRFEKALLPEFEVNVIATMSSGKSTVINAMLGKELMPAKQQACTATIARIEDHDDMKNFQARRLNDKQELIDDWKVVNSKQKGEKETLLEKWNDDEVTSVIEIKGRIPTIRERDNMRLVLVDTPGPNNARNALHEKITISAIEKNLSMVLYILNATNLSAQDDENLLIKINEVIKRGGRKANDRFIFIVNKIDSFDPEDTETVTDALNNVREYLMKNGIENPLVIPASAELTKLIRINEFEGSNALTQRQGDTLNSSVRMFTEAPEMNMLEHVKNSISNKTYEKLVNKIKEAKNNDKKYKEAEILSGIPIVEALLDNFISKHAIPAKLEDAVKSFDSVIEESQCLNDLKTCLSEEEWKLQENAEKMTTALNDKSNIDQAEKFRNKVKNTSYELSKDVITNIENIEINIESFITEQDDKFSGEDLEPRQAKKMFNEIKKACNTECNNIENLLKQDLDKEFKTNIEILQKEYERYIERVLKQSFPDEKDFKLKQLQKHTMSIGLNSMVHEAQYKDEQIDETYTTSTSTWYKPWTWNDTRTYNTYKTVTLVDMEKPWQEIQNTLRYAKDQNIKNFKEAVKISSEIAINILLKRMDIIDEKLKQKEEELRNLTNDTIGRKNRLIEINNQLDWYKDFNVKLNAILEI